jgi:GTP cyclohydrolase II/3,4-dihydroxy 2-butanone 4-phosphate synthase/GTP cyclohydrolase II
MAATLKHYSSALVPTTHGTLAFHVFRDLKNDEEHLAIVKGPLSDGEIPVRIHSECLTGEVFGSLKCDCKKQLDFALDYIAEHGSGMVLYLKQEGRGIGLGNKIKAYELQSQGIDTVEANLKLGFDVDHREYTAAVEMLHHFGVKRVKLITNNPMKMAALEEADIEITGRIATKIEPAEESLEYLKTKRQKTGHYLDHLFD